MGIKTTTTRYKSYVNGYECKRKVYNSDGVVAEEWEEEENDSKRDRKYNENITDACFFGGPNDSTNWNTPKRELDAEVR